MGIAAGGYSLAAIPTMAVQTCRPSPRASGASAADGARTPSARPHRAPATTATRVPSAFARPRALTKLARTAPTARRAKPVQAGSACLGNCSSARRALPSSCAGAHGRCSAGKRGVCTGHANPATRPAPTPQCNPASPVTKTSHPCIDGKYSPNPTVQSGQPSAKLAQPAPSKRAAGSHRDHRRTQAIARPHSPSPGRQANPGRTPAGTGAPHPRSPRQRRVVGRLV